MRSRIRVGERSMELVELGWEGGERSVQLNVFSAPDSVMEGYHFFFSEDPLYDCMTLCMTHNSLQPPALSRTTLEF